MLNVRLYYLSRIHFIWDYLDNNGYDDVHIFAELMDLRYMLKESKCILDNDLLRRIWNVEEEFHILISDESSYGGSLWQMLKRKFACMIF